MLERDIPYLKKSKCQITDQCVLNAYHVSVHKLISGVMRPEYYNYGYGKIYCYN